MGGALGPGAAADSGLRGTTAFAIENERAASLVLTEKRRHSTQTPDRDCHTAPGSNPN